ncbi:MAG: tRNA (adenosine(37)-N6)-threonylcarbamoyltransferase complex dimerization subunit type 1 TsaB [Saprospiraceae bacterium]|nr:tRNA (adenosine(37)-N6)-threonylcarbamoyltransferase complex dimerization subunit type 1 TsaB [Saprospiraceae bacterium]
MEPTILHIETSGRLCSLLLSKGIEPIAQLDDDSGDHQSVIAINIKKILIDNGVKINELDALSANIGPGSYTSLRVGLMMAKGLAHLNNKPLIAKTSLELLAAESIRVHPVRRIHIPLIDARREDVYYAVYDSHMTELAGPQFASLNADWFRSMGFAPEECVISGSGSLKWKNYLSDYQVNESDILLTSRLLLLPSLAAFRQTDFVSPAELLPLYLTDPNITIPKKKL